MKLSNSEVGHALGMSHSSVSRMRTGERVASVDVLERIITEYNADPEALLRAAAAATRGDTQEWVDLLGELFDDGIPDSEELKAG